MIAPAFSTRSCEKQLGCSMTTPQAPPLAHPNEARMPMVAQDHQNDEHTDESLFQRPRLRAIIQLSPESTCHDRR